MERNLQFDEKIKNIVCSSLKGYSNTLKKNERLLNYIFEMTNFLDNENVNLSTRIYCLLNDINELPRCKGCGKVFHNKNAHVINGFIKYCSVKCQHKDPEMQQLLKERISVAVNDPKVREKFKQTCLKKFGATSPLASKEIQEKIKQTNIEKYGEDNPLKSSKIKEKIKNTIIEKYGCENVFANEEIKNKIRSTWMKKYGTNNPNKSDEIKEKIKNTNIEKYGVECHLSLKEIQEQSQITKKKKYGEHLEKIVEKAKKTSLKNWRI